jgi:hypothetical protein
MVFLGGNGIDVGSEGFDRGVRVVAFDRREVVAAVDAAQLVAQPSHGAFPVSVRAVPAWSMTARPHRAAAGAVSGDG